MSIQPLFSINPLIASSPAAAAAGNAATGGTNSTNGSSSTNGTTGASSTGATTMTSQLDNPQMFLQLLISELQNQDPTNPTDPATILQQTSELAQMQSVNTQQDIAQNSEATGLIGKTVTATLSGSTVTGVVTDVQISATGAPLLTVNGSNIALSDVTDVSAGSAGTTTTTTSTSTSGSSGTSGTGA